MGKWGLHDAFADLAEIGSRSGGVLAGFGCGCSPIAIGGLATGALGSGELGGGAGVPGETPLGEDLLPWHDDAIPLGKDLGVCGPAEAVEAVIAALEVAFGQLGERAISDVAEGVAMAEGGDFRKHGSIFADDEFLDLLGDAAVAAGSVADEGSAGMLEEKLLLCANDLALEVGVFRPVCQVGELENQAVELREAQAGV